MIRSLGAFIFLGLAATMPVQQAAAQDVLGGAIVGGALGGILGGALGRRSDCRRGYRRHYRCGYRRRSPEAFERLLLVAGRLLLPLSQRRVAASAAGKLRLLICRFRDGVDCGPRR
jgi:hypothetical protein